ncbi:SDR family oxidoreductase [Bradyrhizobium sp. SZCCHNRI1009]|uniref:SDR family oxidoreductase n=1 Tax=Bradyrhizobium sp. SZCCHNRI1009 TaxID=3057277 RepID=UPI0029166339|nr:SDR family oxidoreductase [Bradyrhizobium sp. SZCCHNRI1009]
MKPVDESLEADEGIAIIGMAGRFPGARSVDALWSMLREGREGIRSFSVDELREAGVAEALLCLPNYVRVAPVVDDYDCFDAEFFGYSAREAALIDPQHRLFLEEAWAALESAGYDCRRTTARIGVYAGANMSSYLLKNLELDGDVSTLVRRIEIFTGNDKDYVATRVSYKLGLTGPSLNVSNACSTSLVAIIVACQQLADYNCEIALAGGVAVVVPHHSGYLYEETNGGLSSDGHCRAFDARADGCVFGSGVGVVALKRLADARKDGDHIYAVIRGHALNNDGAAKVGFMAPSVDGQAEVIAEAQRMAGFDPSTIGFIETHGTGTALGDAIEIAALKRAFTGHDGRNACALGAVKTNIGHLVAAAGVTGLIKAALALHHKEIPATLHFAQSNPRLGLEASPFYVNNRLTPWNIGTTPRRAGVSAFGVGGTNAHVCMEEAPLPPAPARDRPHQLLIFSARNPAALGRLSDSMAAHFAAAPAEQFPDTAFTLQTGRSEMRERRCIVSDSFDDASRRLRTMEGQRVFDGHAGERKRPPIFMFAGAGAARGESIAAIYSAEPVFRTAVDTCAAILRPEIGIDLSALMRPEGEGVAGATMQTAFDRGAVGLPVLVTLEYALATLWKSWGVIPDTVVGYSTGEYLAAHYSGVFDLETLLKITAYRGRLLDEIEGGGMMLVQAGEVEIASRLHDGLVVAAANTPRQSLVSGPATSVRALERQLKQDGIACLLSPIAAAAHSPLVEPILHRFHSFVAGCRLRAPDKPYLSTVTGTWIEDEQATSPDFWTSHVRKSVRFTDAASKLLEMPGQAFIEIGPSDHLCSMMRAQPGFNETQVALPSMRHVAGRVPSNAHLLETLGRLWTSGVEVDWLKFSQSKLRRRVPLPTYSFERTRHWAEPQIESETPSAIGSAREGTAGWLHVPRWRAVSLARATEPRRDRWLLFADEAGLGGALAERLQSIGSNVTLVYPGRPTSAEPDDGRWLIDPSNGEHYSQLMGALAERGQFPDRIAYCWSIAPAANDGDWSALPPLLTLLAALDRHGSGNPVRLSIITTETQDVLMDGRVAPGKTTLLPLSKVVPRETPHIKVQTIDIALPEARTVPGALVEQLIAEITSPLLDPAVAYRGPGRWIEDYEPAPPALETNYCPYREGGVYLILGGLGRIGLSLAEHLFHGFKCRLILVGRTGLPDRPQWDAWIAEHDDRDIISQQMHRIRQIEAGGGVVEVESTDVGDREAVTSLIRRLRERGIKLDGVFHLAGAIERQSFELAADTTPEILARNFRAKVDGTVALADALRPDPPRFCLLASSLAAVFGGLGNAAYAAANQFIDAFARRERARTGALWSSINWTYWMDSEAVDATTNESHRKNLERMLSDRGISSTEGLALIQHVLSVPAEPQWVVSREAPIARIAAQIASPQQPSPRAAVPVRRPQLQTPFVAPRNENERIVSEIWQELLGFEQIGIHDNFFELGGDSLTAVRLAARIRERLHVQIQLRRLVEEPTIERTVHAIEAAETFAAGGPALLQNLRTSITSDPIANRTLVCVPYAGGNAIMYKAMADALPASFTVFALDIMGQDYGDVQSSTADIEDIARACVHEVEHRVTGPIEIYGHCGGTVLALEIARQLESAGRNVTTVFAGAVVPFSSNGAEERRYMNRLEGMSDDALQAFLKILGGIDETLDPEATKFVVASFRRDALATFDYYRRLNERSINRKLNASIFCLVGDADPLVNGYRKRVKHWAQFTDSVKLAVLKSGGHYFVRHQPVEVAALIADTRRFEPIDGSF